MTGGLDDEVSLGEVHTRVGRLYATLPLPERQTLALEAVRSLVSEGLFELRDLSTRQDGRFAAFTEPLEASMARVHDAYITHHDERAGWVFRDWLELTDTGNRVARKLRG